jgi:CheY-like chemotaxis protein
MNLVINASEALYERNGVITLRTGLEELSREAIARGYEGQSLRPGLYVAMEVSDNGAGMSPDLLKRIFEPFFTTKLTGRGLGLAALHGIVRSHQGGIRVHSQLGAGSNFRLLFPAAGAEAKLPPPEPRGSPVVAEAGVLQGTVLVVDDVEAMRAVTVKALRRMALPVLEARDGREALALADAHRNELRLILMDFTMPNMDGEEAYRELRRRGCRAPVILTSGFNEADALARFEGLGLAGFIQKPFTLATLLERVRKVLSGPA